MAASLTTVETSGNGIICRKIDWISHTDGSVSIAISKDGTGAGMMFSGTLLQASFKPGSPAPTDAYDITITNEAGVDVLGGAGANLSSSVATQETPKTTNGYPFILCGPLTLNVTNAGSGKQGSVWLYTR